MGSGFREKLRIAWKTTLLAGPRPSVGPLGSARPAKPANASSFPSPSSRTVSSSATSLAMTVETAVSSRVNEMRPVTSKKRNRSSTPAKMKTPTDFHVSQEQELGHNFQEPSAAAAASAEFIFTQSANGDVDTIALTSTILPARHSEQIRPSKKQKLEDDKSRSNNSNDPKSSALQLHNDENVESRKASEPSEGVCVLCPNPGLKYNPVFAMGCPAVFRTPIQCVKCVDRKSHKPHSLGITSLLYLYPLG